MIDIDGTYFIDADEMQYTLVKKTISKGEKTAGEEMLKTIGYYSKVSSALYSYTQTMMREKVHSGEMSITDAVKEFQRIEEYIRNSVTF